MGMIHEEPFSTLVLDLAKRHGIRHFIETGTYHADASVWAAKHFEHVTTIEFAQGVYEQAVKRFGTIKNICFIQGNSAVELKKITPDLDTPALFWLDGHAGAGFFDTVDRCPLLHALDAVNLSGTQHYIVIDDARAFTSPPPKPFDVSAWPPIDEIMLRIRAKHPYHTMIIRDATIAVPPVAKEQVITFCRQHRPKIDGWGESVYCADPHP